MAESVNSKVRAKVWVTPDQVDQMRTAVLQASADYLAERNDAILATIYDACLRVGELVDIDVEHLREDNTKLYLPMEVQKDYPTENSPPPKTLALASDTTRSLTTYLNTRWKDSEALFPSRSSDRITTQGVRDVVTKAAVEADVRPYKLDGTRGAPNDVSPYALRHGVAYRMMNHEKGNTLYDVRNRLRHRSIQTTEQIYDHIIEA
jgi:integrase/recombinase XerC/integrase/recombinase XerD